MLFCLIFKFSSSEKAPDIENSQKCEEFVLIHPSSEILGNPTLRAKILPILATIAMAAMSAACAWDYDTMSAEAKGLPDLVDALVGRIQIYPPEYYQFRIDRSSKIVANDPANLDELDNLIVAYDNLPQTIFSLFILQSFQTYLIIKESPISNNGF